MDRGADRLLQSDAPIEALRGVPAASGVEPARVLHWIGSTGMTGVETFVLTLAAAQKARGARAAIACDFAGREPLLDWARENGVELP